MRRRSLFLFLALSSLVVYACNPPERTFGPKDGTGGGESVDGSGGRNSSGDGDGDASGGTPDSGDGDGDSGPGGGTGDGDGDGDGTGGNMSVEPCGDGEQSSDEACDDGNTDDDDGCSSTCEVEDGWFCPAADASCLDCRGDDPLAGCPCTVVDEQACAGAHQQARLKCDGTVWGGLADCDGSTLCERDSGECLPVIAECENTSDGYQFCGVNNVRHTCGPDWVTTEEITCAGACQGGSCNAPDCGDGVLQTDTEDCDDGNLNNGDGCDEQCTRTPGWYCPEVNKACLNCSGGPKVACPCVDPDYPSGGYLAGEDACNGAAQKVSLECSTSTQLWATGPVCNATQNCEQATGLCKTIVNECSGRTAGYTYCAPGDVRHVCDADLVNTSTTTCQGVCSGGACQAPRCGDGKIQAGEACDDGNNTAADGCEPASSSAPCQESGIINVASGRDFTCALLIGGYVRCWGNNEKGQLGVGNTTFYGNKHPREIPLVGLSEAAVALSVARFHACVVTASGAIECWGDNTLGQLGQGTATPNFSASPKRIDFGTDAVQVSSGGYHACARLTNGSVRCWGDNSSGQLGILASTTVSTTTAATALAVPKLGANAQEVGANEVASCALLTGGGVRCWGGNLYGELGLGLDRFSLVGDNEDPEDVSLLAFKDGKSIKDLAVGTNHLCGVGTGAESQCWGRNTAGQLGVSDKVNVGRENLALASGKDIQLSEAVSVIAGGGSHTCAISTTQALRCWGSNAYGQLGFADITSDGVVEEEWGGATAQQAYKVPNLLTGSLAATQIGLGTSHTCVLSQNGELRCWGRNESSQLGLGYVSSGGKDYVGKTAAELPPVLPAVEVFP